MYKKLKEDLNNFKNETANKDNERIKLLNELTDEDKCPFC